MLDVSSVSDGARIVAFFNGVFTMKMMNDKFIMNPNGKYLIVEITDKPTIKDTLVKLGIDSTQHGANYIHDAISMGLENWDYVDMITKLLYPEIAKRYNVTTQHIERAIRSSIEASWDKADLETREKIFGEFGTKGIRRPSNSTYLKCVVKYLS